MLTRQRLQARLEPVRAQAHGLDAEQADAVDDWAGRRARATLAGSARLPELAADVDGFDPDTMTGEIEAYPSVLGRAYRMGFFTWHQLEPGCFDESIADQDGRMPVYVQHAWDWSERPPIGHTSEAEEVDLTDEDGQTRAIRIAGRLYPDVPDGLACLRCMAAGALREWSIGYLLEEYSVEEDDENARTIIHVSRAQLWESSVVLRGANPWTRTEDVASDGSARAARAARLLEVSPAELEEFMASREDAPPEVNAPDPDLQRRVDALEVRAGAPTFSKFAHRVRE